MSGIPANLQKILALQYELKEQVKEAVKSAPNSRHVILKVFETEHPTVLGISVGLNLMSEREFFSEEHLVQAIQNECPDASPIEHSFLAQQFGKECTLYLEMQKQAPFSQNEFQSLQKKLPWNIQENIELSMPSLFMPRNEEEIMRNVTALSAQIKYVSDLPQISLSFDKQTEDELFYTLVIVHLRKSETPAIVEIIKKGKTACQYVHERNKEIGTFRKKYLKEAAIFSVRVPKTSFMRKDRSIDLAKARQCISGELLLLIGQYRDYNGGMLSKQLEVLNAVQNLLPGHSYNPLLLENFFYALTPEVMKTVLEPSIIAELFKLLLQVIAQGSDQEIIFASHTLSVQCQMPKLQAKASSHIVWKGVDYFAFIK